MDAPSQEELDSLRAAGLTREAELLVHWRSAFGLIIIETRGDQVFVNGDPVQPARILQANAPEYRAPATSHPDMATTPFLRTKALMQTKELLQHLAGEQDGAPACLMARARELLQHYPSLLDIDALHRAAPEVLGPPPPFSRLSGSGDVQGVIDGTRNW